MQTRKDPLGQEYIQIPAGEYGIGSVRLGSHPNESPIRTVKLRSEVWVSIRPVLQSIWSEVCGSNPSRFSDGFEAGLRPVERIDWISANNFGDRLAEFFETMDGWHHNGIFRLPSEAEWEIAARAGTKSEWYSGDADRDIHEHVWNAGNSGGCSKMVSQKEANPWGIHDICGNVAEWCSEGPENWVLMGACYKDHAGDPCTVRKTPSREWNDTDPQIPKSIWWLSDAPFAGFRVVCKSTDPENPALEKKIEEKRDDDRPSE